MATERSLKARLNKDDSDMVPDEIKTELEEGENEVFVKFQVGR